MNEGTKRLLIVCIAVCVLTGIVSYAVTGRSFAAEARPHWTSPPLFHERFDHVDARKGDIVSFSLGCDIGPGARWDEMLKMQQQRGMTLNIR